MNSGITGKVVVITGASSGIGENTARHLAALGAKVVLGARRTDKLAALVSSIKENGGHAAFLATDVTCAQSVQALVSKAISEFSRVDVIINNAGLMAIAPMEQARVSEWDNMIDINLKGVLYGIAAVIPLFKQQGYGHVINVSSIAGLKVFSPGGTVYSATKFAVQALSEGLRYEMAGKVRVTTIQPGATQTELKFGSSDASTQELLDNEYKNAIPAEAISRAIAFAIEQPDEFSVNELTLRPTAQQF